MNAPHDEHVASNAAAISKRSMKWAADCESLCREGPESEAMVLAALVQVLRIVLHNTNQPLAVRGKVMQAIARPGTSALEAVQALS